MPSALASKHKCFACFSLCSSQHPESQALPCHIRPGRGGLLSRHHHPPAITQSGGDAACTGEANVSKLGRGRQDGNFWKVFC